MQVSSFSLITLPALSFIVCAAMTPLIKRAAVRSGWVAIPREDRWHKKPTALLGGIAIYCAAGLPIAWFSDFGSMIEFAKGGSAVATVSSYAAVAWVGISALFILGLLDDLVGVRPHNKLIVQILVASAVAFLGYRLQWSSSLTGDTVLTIIWIVGITNAVNLLDNMDGLCAGITLIAVAFFSFLHYSEGAFQFLAVSLFLAGATAAFLTYNFNPASIFMGDCGSLPLGFALSMLCLYPATNRLDTTVSVYAIPVLVLMIPIFDTTMVTVVRILSGRKPSMGGRDHTSHRLVLMGFSERGAVLFLYGTAVTAGLAAVFVQRHDSLAAPTVIIPLLLSVVLMGIYLAQIRVYPEKEFSVIRETRFTPIIMEITLKRQIFHVMLDLVLVMFAYYTSYRVRFGFGGEFGFFFQMFLKSLPAIIICKFAAFFATGVYKGMWRYMGLSDVFVFLKASLLGTLFSLAIVTYVYRFAYFSKGVFLIDWFLTAAFLIASRVSFRTVREFTKQRTVTGTRVVIYGAGRGGQVLLREMLNDNSLGVKPIGFVDDDTGKTGKRLYGFPVLGTGVDLEEVIEKNQVGGVVISCRNMQQEAWEKLLRLCRLRDIAIKRFVVALQDVDPYVEQKDHEDTPDNGKTSTGSRSRP